MWALGRWSVGWIWYDTRGIHDGDGVWMDIIYNFLHRFALLSLQARRYLFYLPI